ncbi:MAG TPA: fructose-1,6-bisphosphate aldolase/phosphatase [Anaerolineae bacterium]|nr:fructose-1,6-bisphosphate aldolase/phosphatase [Anaerolineae bacterium]
MTDKVTLSVIKADVGGYVGHSSMHDDLIKEAEDRLELAKDDGTLIDFHVSRVGDDLELIMTHQMGVDSSKIHQLAWNTLEAAAEVAKSLKLYGAGQDLLSDAFSGNVKGMGPGVAEMEIKERASEPILIFMADKTSAGAWNMPLVKMFADPFTTIGLVISPALHGGFRFEVQDVLEHKKIYFDCPDELYDLVVFVGAPARYMVKAVYHRDTNEIGAASSTQRLSLLAGRYVGKDDPVLIVRSQGNFPAVGEVLEPFAFPYLVEGWMRGSHHGPLMPVSVPQSNPSRFDGPPRVVCLGFQLCNGSLVGPRDMFDDPSFDETRRQANLAGEYMRRHGPFEPHRLPLGEMEYTTMPELMEKLAERFEDVTD